MHPSHGYSRKWESKEYAEARKDAAEERKRRLSAAAQQRRSRTLSPHQHSTRHRAQDSTGTQYTSQTNRQVDTHLSSPESQYSLVDVKDRTELTQQFGVEEQQHNRLKAQRDRFRRVYRNMLAVYGNPPNGIDPLHRYNDRFKKNKVQNHSTMVPWTFEEWLAHQGEMAEAEAQKQRRNIQNVRHRRTASCPVAAFRGKNFADGRGCVLAEKTIWCPSHDDPDRRGGHVWPTTEAMLFEGDQRQASAVVGNDFRRFLPLVRHVRADDNIDKWGELMKMEPYSFDEIWKPPEMPDVYFEREGVLDGDVSVLLNKDILEAIDDPT